MPNPHLDYRDFRGDIRTTKENNAYTYYVSVSGHDDAGEIRTTNADECPVIFRGMVDDILMKNPEALPLSTEMKVFVGQYAPGNGKPVKTEYVLAVGDNDAYTYFTALFGDENPFNITVDASRGFAGKFTDKAASLARQLLSE